MELAVIGILCNGHYVTFVAVFDILVLLLIVIGKHRLPLKVPLKRLVLLKLLCIKSCYVFCLLVQITHEFVILTIKYVITIYLHSQTIKYEMLENEMLVHSYRIHFMRDVHLINKLNMMMVLNYYSTLFLLLLIIF